MNEIRLFRAYSAAAWALNLPKEAYRMGCKAQRRLRKEREREAE